MPANSPRVRKFRDCAENGDLTGFEEHWLTLIDTAPTEVEIFIAGAECLEKVGNFDRAALFLHLAWPPLASNGHHEGALRILKKIASIPSKAHPERDAEVRRGLVDSYRASHAAAPHLEVYLESAGLIGNSDLKTAVRQLDIFLTLNEGRYVFHPAGWGAGRIAKVDPEDLSVVIDFEERAGHRISMEMAAKVTESLDPMDLRALRFDRREQLLDWIDSDPLELIRAALRSRRGKANLREVRDRLTNDLIDAKAWSRWWQKTRQLIKGAEDLTVTPGSNPTLELGVMGAGGYPAACLKDLGTIADDSKRVRYLRDMMRESEEHEDGPDAIARVVGILLGGDGQARNMDFGSRISLGFLLVEAKERVPEIEVPRELTEAELFKDREAILEILPMIPISAHRTGAYSVLKRDLTRDETVALAETVILRGEADAADVALADLLRFGEIDLINRIFATISARYREMPNAFLWYVRFTLGKKLRQGLRLESLPALAEKALILHSEIEVSNIRKANSERLKAAKGLESLFQSKDWQFIRDAFGEAGPSEAKSLANTLRNNRSLKQDARDRMIRAMHRTRPELSREAVAASPVPEVNPLFDPRVIWCLESSLLRKRTEYEDLVNRQIPENAAEIGRAASYGDLSENAEWSAAIEKQTQLTRLSEELAGDIDKARLITESMLGGTQVGVALGAKVIVQAQDGEERNYTVLGPWEVDATKGIISYLSPLGRALVGKSPGDLAEVEVPSGKLSYKVVSFTPSRSLADLAKL